MNSLDSVERRRGHLVNWHVSIFVFNYCFYRKYFHTEYYAAKKRNQFFFLSELKGIDLYSHAGKLHLPVTEITRAKNRDLESCEYLWCWVALWEL